MSLIIDSITPCSKACSYTTGARFFIILYVVTTTIALLLLILINAHQYGRRRACHACSAGRALCCACAKLIWPATWRNAYKTRLHARSSELTEYWRWQIQNSKKHSDWLMTKRLTGLWRPWITRRRAGRTCSPNSRPPRALIDRLYGLVCMYAADISHLTVNLHVRRKWNNAWSCRGGSRNWWWVIAEP